MPGINPLASSTAASYGAYPGVTGAKDAAGYPGAAATIPGATGANDAAAYTGAAGTNLGAAGTSLPSLTSAQGNGAPMQIVGLVLQILTALVGLLGGQNGGANPFADALGAAGTGTAGTGIAGTGVAGTNVGGGGNNVGGGGNNVGGGGNNVGGGGNNVGGGGNNGPQQPPVGGGGGY